MSDVVLTKELLRDEAQTILRSLRENVAAGRSNRIADVKQALEARVTVDFDDYFLFLRKHNFIVLDREHSALELTTEGDGALDGEPVAMLSAIEEFFAGRLGDEVATGFELDHAPTEIRRVPPPVPTEIPVDLKTDPKQRLPPPLQLTAVPAATARSPFDANPSVVAPSPAAREAALRPFESSRPSEVPSIRTSPDGSVPRAEPQPAAPALTIVPVAAPLPKESRGTELDLRYVKYDAIGGGALGTVYRGKQTALGTEVAIKELRDIFGYFSFLQRGEVTKRLKKEICAQAQLRHPGVVQLLDQNTDVARPYYVMELVPGGNLRQKLDALGGKALPVPQALRYFLQIAYAMRAAHQIGLFHQNLKPENVLIDALGNAKLSDFGLTRVVDTDSVAKQMPQVFLGTGGMGYLPPELLSGKKDFGAEGDLYMLGLLLYEMLTGCLPGRRSPLPSAANSAVPVKLDPIFDRMTQDKREARYQGVDALLDDFYQAFSDGRFQRRGDLLLFAQPPEPIDPATPDGEEAAKRTSATPLKERRPV